MIAVVDTDVIAYYLLGTEPFVEETRAFWKGISEASAPAHWQAELANVIWMATSTGVLPAAEGYRRLDFASRLRVHSVALAPLWQTALAMSIERNVSPYDTLFVALASDRNLPLATFDQQLLETFPEVARRPEAIIR